MIVKDAYATGRGAGLRGAELTRCAHFGLLPGQREDLALFGALGFLVQGAPLVRTALDLAMHHYRVHNPNATIGVIEGDSFVTFRDTIL